MWSIFGCGKKNEATNEVAGWLEKNFPNQFEIISNEYAVNTWISLDRSKFRLVLSVKKDPEIQFIILWNKNMPDGGISPSNVKDAFENASAEIEQARGLLKLFLNQGLQNISVGVAKSNSGYVADVLFYTNQGAKESVEYFSKFIKAAGLWNLNSQTHFWICLMETDYFGKDFKQIIPSRFIHELTNSKGDNCFIYIETEWKQGLTPSQLLSKCTINLNSHRALNQYGEQAFAAANAWTKSNPQKSIFLREHGMTTELNSKDPMSIDFCFPYFNSEQEATAEPKYDEKIEGYLCATFHVDQRNLTNVKLKKDVY